jgi:hypothetical protein
MDAACADPADRSILVLGSPRSGTTWLAKIVDSHPDVLYRHEPDEVSPPIPSADPRRQLLAWINERSLRVAAKPPLFRKSWLPPPLALARSGMAQVLKGVARMRGQAAQARLPDFVSLTRRSNLRPLLKLVNWEASAVLRTVPGCRCLFILRHPCGHVASTMTGVAQRRFAPRADGSLSPIEEAPAVAFAAKCGMDAAAFRALPVAARIAWSWLAFNEVALADLGELPNARMVLYEELCVHPEAVARNLFDFIGLDWHPQTAEFVARSTRHEGEADYFAVFRSSDAVAQQWRSTMLPADQEAVRLVVRHSPLARHWADLCG